MATNAPAPRRIIVGVTGDAAARDALRWAARVARLDDALLVAVTAYEPPRPVLTLYGLACVDARDAEFSARFVQDNVLLDALRTDARGVRVWPVVTRGEPADVLVAAASDADLLVVGRREPSGRRLPRPFSHSVSRECADRAPCPVVIVRQGVGSRTPAPEAFARLLAPADEPFAGPAVRAAIRGASHHGRRHPRFERRHPR